ncbi:sigma factor-like helix-turn-helix DNA-binding protein [Bacillus nakamurai]|uniref:RNA polymerase subunit sigma n=1 Tax=Bacillus nakamurai TaxID=1793963 RepID=A0A150F7W6_9BACI|nr:sigma factor-like helix-turn-helix DNA-binding protein [Bacillus nakamurai]KXZ17732.1 RNA polymerase subunit sigma [Bacillus nakamurai]MED1227632.1 sigma factor-like helix-turn-helix DNA-binding protein [Bacillus nakamurai]
MGSATNRPDQHRKYEADYKLNDSEGVRSLLRDYHKLCHSRINGDYAASDILLDLEDAIDAAMLTALQKRALTLIYIEDLTQREAADEMGIERSVVSKHVTAAVNKIAEIYAYWADRGEGYCVN